MHNIHIHSNNYDNNTRQIAIYYFTPRQKAINLANH